MAKKLNEWLDDFVNNGFTASNILIWPEEGGGGQVVIEVDDVSDVSYDDATGIATWTPGDYSELEQYNPTITYTISANNQTLETATNSLDISSILNEGDNEIVVKTKVVIQLSEKSYNMTFSDDVDAIATHIDTSTGLKKLTVKLPKALSSMGVIGNGTDIYIVGGVDENNAVSGTIYKMNCLNNTITEFATLPAGIANPAIGIYDGYLHVVGGLISGSNFGTITYTMHHGTATRVRYKINLSTAEVTSYDIPRLGSGLNWMPYMQMNGVGQYGTKIYMLGGTDFQSTVRPNVLYFNLLTETYTDLGQIMPYTGAYNLDNTAVAQDVAASLNSLVFAGGEYNSSSSSVVNEIFTFSLSSSTTTKKTAHLPDTAMYASAAVYRNKAYIAGGVNASNNAVQSLCSYNLTNDTTTVVEANAFENGIFRHGMTTANNALYIFGGKNGLNQTLDTIYRYRAE